MNFRQQIEEHYDCSFIRTYIILRKLLSRQNQSMQVFYLYNKSKFQFSNGIVRVGGDYNYRIMTILVLLINYYRHLFWYLWPFDAIDVTITVIFFLKMPFNFECKKPKWANITRTCIWIISLCFKALKCPLLYAKQGIESRFKSI